MTVPVPAIENDNTEAARRYHDGTKHPDGALMDHRHSFDPMRQPVLFKTYSDLEPMPLALGTKSEVPALMAISRDEGLPSEDGILDVGLLASVLHYSAGITKTISYPWADMHFRAAACTGALYHIELYAVCGDLPGLEAGVYHFDPSGPALRRLRRGDFRPALMDATGEQPSLVQAPATIVYTDVFWRNACKYQAREYRHAYWDSGTIISHTLAMASAHDLRSELVAGFVDQAVNALLGVDTRREAAVAMVALGQGSKVSGPPLKVETLSLSVEPVSEVERDFPRIREMHRASSLTSPGQIISWRGSAAPAKRVDPSEPLVVLQPLESGESPTDSIEDVIVRRGSSRRFAREPITFRQLSTVIDRSTRPIPADFLEGGEASLIDLFMVANAVDGLEPGTYALRQEARSLALLRAGEFRREAGVLGLNQALPVDASACLFFMADLDRALTRFGNRGYRVAQLEASITAGRCYLAAYAQRLGATGLTFHDDLVTEFFSPQAQGMGVMFLLAIGKRAVRRR